MKNNILIMILISLTLAIMGSGGVLYDNLYLNGSTIESIVTNGSLHFKPDGTGGGFVHTSLRIGASTVGDTDLELDVVGDGAITSSLKIGGASDAATGIELDLVGDSVMTGQLTVGATTLASAGYGLDVTGNTFLSGSLSVNKTTLITSGLEFETTGAGLISGVLTVGSSTVANENIELELTGDAQFSSSLGIGTTVGAQASALLEMISTTRGLLPPRMTTTQRDAISAPAEGLVISNTTSNTIDFFNGSIWVTLISTADAVTSSQVNLVLESANLNCDAGSVITTEKGSWLTSIGNISGGQCLVTIDDNLYSTSPFCLAIESDVGGTPVILAAGVTSATVANVDCADNAGSDCGSFNANFFCLGE